MTSSLGSCDLAHQVAAEVAAELGARLTAQVAKESLLMLFVWDRPLLLGWILTWGWWAVRSVVAWREELARTGLVLWMGRKSRRRMTPKTTLAVRTPMLGSMGRRTRDLVQRFWETP